MRESHGGNSEGGKKKDMNGLIFRCWISRYAFSRPLHMCLKLLLIGPSSGLPSTSPPESEGTHEIIVKTPLINGTPVPAPVAPFTLTLVTFTYRCVFTESYSTSPQRSLFMCGVLCVVTSLLSDWPPAGMVINPACSQPSREIKISRGESRPETQAVTPSPLCCNVCAKGRGGGRTIGAGGKAAERGGGPQGAIALYTVLHYTL